MKNPEWFEALCSSDYTSQVKLVALCRILGVAEDASHRVVPSEEYCFLRGDVEALEVQIRTLLFKKPEEALSALTALAIETKREILQDPMARADLRVKVADDVLDRVLGKATQTMQIASVSVTADAKDLASIDRDLALTMKRISTIESSTKLLTGAKTLSQQVKKTPLLSADGIRN